MISEGSCDTEYWSNDEENSAFYDWNKVHFKIENYSPPPPPTWIYTPYTILTKRKQNCHNFVNVLTQSLAEAPSQPQVVLDMIWQALLISVWQLSSILLLTSSRLKLCQVGLGQMHIFRFLQNYLIGFMLWLCHSKTFTALFISHSCCS